MKSAAPKRFTALAATAIVLFATTDAFGQFRPGVVGTRSPRWASSVPGRMIQAGVAIGMAVVLFRVLRPQLRREKRKWNPDDLNSPENAKDFWNPTDRGPE